MILGGIPQVLSNQHKIRLEASEKENLFQTLYQDRWINKQTRTNKPDFHIFWIRWNSSLDRCHLGGLVPALSSLKVTTTPVLLAALKLMSWKSACSTRKSQSLCSFLPRKYEPLAMDNDISCKQIKLYFVINKDDKIMGSLGHTTLTAFWLIFYQSSLGKVKTRIMVFTSNSFKLLENKQKSTKLTILYCSHQ